MDTNNFETFSVSDALEYFQKSADAIILADGKNDRYRTIIKRKTIAEMLPDEGSYLELVEKLWYHFNKSDETITENYKVFIPISGRFKGKYSKRLNIFFNHAIHIFQMTVHPIVKDEIYLIIIDELDKTECIDEKLTTKKVDTIQNTYLFSMYFDIIRDTTNSVCVTEISEETLNTRLKYSEWRKTIVNMIWKDDQELFMERTSPEYLKKNFAPGRTSSFDCLMQNLEGKYIWVKLIFSRAETKNDDDYRFVFMVQDIHENTEKLISTLKKYEDLASKDSLTSVYNRGRIETEIDNAIDKKKKTGEPVSMMILDIDYFKQVNDSFGHSVGDGALVRFSEIINEYIGNYNAVLGRWGGEEFVVVFYDTDINKIGDIAEELRQKIESENFTQIGKLTCSIGTTEVRADDDTLNAFDRMDKALYEAKSSGRNNVKSL